MTRDLSLRFSEDELRLTVETVDEDGSATDAGPALSEQHLRPDGRRLAAAIFGDATAGPVDDKLLGELVSRMEQLAIDKLYAAPVTGREVARARVVLAWAIIVIERLTEKVEDDPKRRIGARLDRLVGLVGSEGVDPLRVADTPTVVPEGDTGEIRAERSIARQIKMYAQRKRLRHHLNAIEDDIAGAVYMRPPLSDRREIADRIAGHLDRIRGVARVVGPQAIRRFDGARETLSAGRLPDETASSVREIELHPFRNRWALFYEIASGIAFTTFSSAGSFVFLGTRLQKCTGVCQAGGVKGFSASLDIIALVICSFGFLFATLAYANGTGVLARFSTMGYTDSVERGNRVSEYFGVYPLIFAIPLAVEQSTSSPIPSIVKAVGLVSFLGYHWASGFSLLERVISDDALGTDGKRRLIVAALLTLLTLVWFGPNIAHGTTGLWLRLAASAAFLGLITVIYMLAAIVPEQGRPSRYRVHRDDVISDESPSLVDVPISQPE